MTSVDLLIIMAHPDDAELCCSGTILSCIDNGLSVGMIDLTRGELGTRGSGKVRIEEAKNAAKVLGVNFRYNLELRDGFISDDEESIFDVIKVIREFKPKVIITNSKTDRHPDHESAARLVKKACFLSGLIKISTKKDNLDQESWRPKSLLYSIQNNYIEPHFVVDVSKYIDVKINAIKCFKSQFYDPKSNENDSFISTKEFMDFIKSRSIEMGHSIGVKHGEGFTSENKLKLTSLDSFF
ncbi:MAG: bacillithiol biosynthesis deacetylase BshB1 [Cytophagales bacterium]